VKAVDKYAFMEANPEYAAAKWAKMLKISLSGYHAWRGRKESRNNREQSFRERIRKLFENSEGTYGVDRICGKLRNTGIKASYPRVKRHMEAMGLKSIHRKRRQRSLTNSKKSRGEGFPNLVKDLEIRTPFQVLSSDISYIRTDEGFGYVCQIRDVVSNIVLAHSTANHMRSELVVQTIRQAMTRWRLPEGTIIHSDRGSQYTSDAVSGMLKKNKWQQSFSRVGMPGDNAWSESFFSILKKERVHWRHFRTVEEVRQSLFEYIEVFYNRRRVQKRLGYLSPMQWLKQLQLTARESVA